MSGTEKGAIMTIDNDQREIFAEMYEDGIAIDVIADRFGITIAAAEKRVERWGLGRRGLDLNGPLPGDQKLVHDWLLDQGILCEERPMPIVEREESTP